MSAPQIGPDHRKGTYRWYLEVEGFVVFADEKLSHFAHVRVVWLGQGRCYLKRGGSVAMPMRGEDGRGRDKRARGKGEQRSRRAEHEEEEKRRIDDRRTE
eukprot:1812884-Rhodomonas_salina.1